MTSNFIWDNLVFGKDILQHPIEQSQHGCAYTATSRQCEYQLRIAYAQTDPPVRLNKGQMFDHIGWEKEAGTGTRSIRKLLLQLSDKYLWNHCRYVSKPDIPLRIKDSYNITNGGEPVPVDKVLRLLEKKIPLVAVFHVDESYPYEANIPYYGKPLPPADPKQITHAVVLVGSYIATEANYQQHPVLRSPGTYYWFQESKQPCRKIVGLLEEGYGLNLLNPDIVVKVYYGISEVSDVLLNPIHAKEMSKKKKFKVNKRINQKEQHKIEKAELEECRVRLRGKRARTEGSSGV